MHKQVIAFHYQLKNDKGEILDSSKSGEPLMFLEGSHQIIEGLEKALVKLEKGAKSEIFVPYQEGYGAYDQKLVGTIARSQFPPGPIKVGDVFQSEKNGQAQMITVIEISDTTVTIDGNHPMAGKNLYFSVEIVERREATPEEVAHGHAHPHPHSH